jgi:hypothetical protein
MKNEELSDMIDDSKTLSEKLRGEEDNYFHKLLDSFPDIIDKYFYMGVMFGSSTKKDLENLEKNNPGMYHWLMERKESGKNAYRESVDGDSALFVEYQNK